MTELDKARQIINEVDKEMASLFEKRMDAAKVVAQYKKEHGLQITDKNREEELVKRNSSFLKNEEYLSYYVNFLRNNMDISKQLQHLYIEGMRVAYSGVEGAFGNIAAEKIFPGARTKGYSDFKATFRTVEKGECDCAVLPIENSYNGDVGQVMDLSFSGTLFITGVYDISVVQNLLGVKGARIEDIKTVMSHSQALGQCAEYIEKHGFDTKECVNTAVAAKEVAKLNNKEIAAIGSVEAGEKFGLQKIDGHINESSDNTTRFAVFARVPEECKKTNRFVLLFTVKNEAGTLGKAVSKIGSFGFNMRSLKSRPTKDLIWSYYFFAECEGDIGSENGEKMLKELSSCCDTVRVLGRYEKEISL